MVPQLASYMKKGHDTGKFFSYRVEHLTLVPERTLKFKTSPLLKLIIFIFTNLYTLRNTETQIQNIDQKLVQKIIYLRLKRLYF